MAKIMLKRIKSKEVQLEEVHSGLHHERGIAVRVSSRFELVIVLKSTEMLANEGSNERLLAQCRNLRANAHALGSSQY